MSGKIRFYKILFYLLIIPHIILFLNTCKKEDPQKIRKEELMQRLVDGINSDSLKADVLWFQNIGTRFALADNHKSVAVKIQNRFIQMGYTDTALDSFLINKTYRNVVYEQWQYNVIATIEGSEYPDSLCVIGGHYDDILVAGDPFTIVPGANDNASGVAGVMEIARVMKYYGFEPVNTIMFIAFCSEEIGLWGSRDFAASPNGFTQRIKFMLNNDMIAYEPLSDPALWYINIIDYDNSHALRTDAEKMCAKYTQLNFRNDNTHNKQSDSYPFFTNGYKALFFFSDQTDPNYHTSNDLAANCNFDYCREVTKISCAILADKN